MTRLNLWSQGHIAWLPFAGTIFTILLLLCADVLWRVTKTRLWVLALYFSGGWLIGLAVLYALL
jgi:hypothetical protein